MPPTLHFQRPNPQMNLAASPFRVENALVPWAERGHPRRAGVSAFGIGGTNAHVVLEEAPEQPAATAPARPRLLVVSARTDAAADARVRDLADHLDRHPEADLADVAHTLQVGRRHFESRRCLVASDVDEARTTLRAGRLRRGSGVQSGRPVGLVLAGVPDSGVAAELAVLYETEPAFRAAVDECRAVPGLADAPDGRLFATLYALVRLLAARGVAIDALAGDSVGEIVAATVAGVLPLPGALGLLARRGAGSRDAVEAWVRDNVVLAAPHLRYVTNVTGTWVTAEQATDPGHWARVLTSAARLVDAVAVMRADELVLVAADARTLPPDVHAAIGELWLAGADVDWDAYSAGESRRIVALPTYPFQRERYWIDPPSVAGAPDAKAGKRPPDEWLWVPRWEPEEGGDGGDGAGPTGPTGPFLVLAETDRATDAVVARLAGYGSCVTVRPGDTFGVPDGDSFVLRPDEPGDYDRLARLLAATGRLPATVVHLWGVTGAVPDATDPAVMARHRRRGFDSVVWLSRALSEAGCTAVRILVGTDHMQAVDGSEALVPGKASVLGACLAVPQEYPGFTCASVDVAGGDPPALDDVVARELERPSAGGVAAYRGRTRTVRSFVPVPAPAPTPLLRDHGVYLLTGGLGNVGLLLAEHFARSARAPRLVLTGRAGLPPRSEWDAVLDREPSSATGRRIRAVRTIEELGARVLVVAADGADPASMRAAVEQARERFGRVHGVVHAAGLPGVEHFSLLSGLQSASIDAHFAAKVDSLIALDAALGGEQLDFSVLQSSISSVLGGLGFAAYAAANCVLDAYAEVRARAGARWVSVDWDTWQPTAASAAGASMQQYSMTGEEGLAAFDRASAVGAPRVVVSTGDLTARLGQWVGVEHDAAPVLRVGELFPRPELPELFVRPTSDDQRRLADLWQQVLGLDRVGINDNFFELGGNSLMGLQLARRISEEFSVHLPAVAIFEAPTVAGLAARLAGALEPAGHADPAVGGLPPVGTGGHDIAIVGLACRFPGATGADEFWRNLRDGVESIRTFTAEELVAAGVPAELAGRPDYVKARPVLDGIEEFDQEFFDMDAGEAALTDPQHRIFLECCWHALEDAGHPPRAFPGQVGVFAGSNISTYLAHLLGSGALPPWATAYQAVIANDKDALTTAVSYKLGLTGPSMAVQSFCSTSLVAVHQAVRALRAGDCDMALAGGVSVRVPGRVGHLAAGAGRESTDGHVRAFDARADGSMYGDGAGVVVLRRLADARTDGDTIRAVIKGSAVTNDGAARAGFAAPSVAGQTDAARRALRDARVGPETISYVEAHGTGTPLSDAVEFTALSRAFGDGPARGSCPIGSVKTNVGHLDQAAGVSGLVKTVLAIEHGQIPATLHFAEPNPEIDLATSPFHVNTRLVPWEAAPEGAPPLLGRAAQEGRGALRRAVVHAFGSGGTNAHVVLEQAPAPQPDAPGRPWLLLPLSARSEVALERATANLAGYLREHPEVSLPDVAHTLQVGRDAFAHRRIVLCATRDEAVATLAGSGGASGNWAARQGPPVALVFAGLSDIDAADVAALHDSEPLFRAVIADCCGVADPLFDADVRAVLLGAVPRPGPGSVVAAAGYIAGYALATQLASWGVRADAPAGDEVGCRVAATLAGRVTPFEALRALAQPGGRPHPATEGFGLGCVAEQPADCLIVDVGPGGVARDGGRALHATVGALWLAGVGIDWAAYSAGRGHRRVPLPTYPFQRQRCWADPPARPELRGDAA